jgi:hypothetical protein
MRDLSTYSGAAGIALDWYPLVCDLLPRAMLASSNSRKSFSKAVVAFLRSAQRTFSDYAHKAKQRSVRTTIETRQNRN